MFSLSNSDSHQSLLFLSVCFCIIRRQLARLHHRTCTSPPSFWPGRELRKYHCGLYTFLADQQQTDLQRLSWIAAPLRKVSAAAPLRLVVQECTWWWVFSCMYPFTIRTEFEALLHPLDEKLFWRMSLSSMDGHSLYCTDRKTAFGGMRFFLHRMTLNSFEGHSFFHIDHNWHIPCGNVPDEWYSLVRVHRSTVVLMGISLSEMALFFYDHAGHKTVTS